MPIVPVEGWGYNTFKFFFTLCLFLLQKVLFFKCMQQLRQTSAVSSYFFFYFPLAAVLNMTWSLVLTFTQTDTHSGKKNILEFKETMAAMVTTTTNL